MQNKTEKKKPVKLEWQGGLLESKEESPVSLKGQKPSVSKHKDDESFPIHGKVSLRYEKKGRGGNPVLVMTNFSDPNAKNSQSLKKLCSNLKEKLACGGTVENGEIVLMIRDEDRLKKILSSDFGIKV